MNERDLEARLRNTYRAEAQRADPGALTERVHSIPAAAEAARRRWWPGFGSGVTRRTDPGGARRIGGINMLVSMRTAAVVAIMAVATSLLAVQVGNRTDPVTPGATEPGGSWVTVTGTQEVVDMGYGNGVAMNSMSDARLSGDVAITFRAATEPGNDEDNYALWGTVTITNDGGTWQGQWIGFKDDQERHHITSWYQGTGDYDGLLFLAQGVQREPDGLLDVTGLVYEGTIPSTVIPPQAVE